MSGWTCSQGCCQFDSYADYLLGAHWKDQRLQALAAARNRCQICNSPSDLQVHHRTYERVGHESTGDLTVLCGRCHRAFHGQSQVEHVPRVKRPTRSDIRQRVLTFLDSHPDHAYGTKDLSAAVGLPVYVVGDAAARLHRASLVRRPSKRTWASLSYTPPAKRSKRQPTTSSRRKPDPPPLRDVDLRRLREQFRDRTRA